MAINFNQIGSFKGISGDATVLSNPTSLQFGPDGRLYVSEQNGAINAFTIALQDGEYIATAHEELLLSNGGGVVQSIANHDDDGEKNPLWTDRQVTGLVTTGTATNPVLYVSSSDPRISTDSDVNLDTNSGVLTQVTWTGSEWEAVDIIRGLPRSEENHSNNGMVLSADGTKLYLTVGGNTNNGAPSQFFTYTGEYALSGTVLEIDLVDIENRSVLNDLEGGLVDGATVARSYVYDLPTLDDPSVVNDGVREDAGGLDVAGPWGGNDGFNMAILPADAPLRIYADGFRNHYDIVLSESGQFYTIDNGSNGGLGGDPVVGVDGEATNQPNDGGSGDPEPLFLIEDGGYYGHPTPARANQDLPWTVYDDNADPDGSLSVNSVPNLSALVPDSVNIAPGFVIDPSKFTGDPARLLESGIRIKRDGPESNAIVTIGSSSNGLVEYTANAFDGALQGALLTAQFNGNITALKLNAAGTALEPIVDPGDDNLLGTGDDFVLDADGVYPLIGGLAIPLDVTTGPDGTVWVVDLADDFVKVFAPSSEPPIDDFDFDNDGIENIVDPFIRDKDNGKAVVLFPGQTLLWDFDANQDNNLPGPDGYGGGLTGVMINGVTDFEAFFQEPSFLPGQDVNLDNVKFITAAGGGTTVIENVSSGSPATTENNGEYLFHTGVTISPTVETFTVTWTIFNPASELVGASQQIGGYIGTGDQSNYIKLVAIQSPAGEIQILLEDNDTVVASSFIQADDLFAVPADQQIFFDLTVDPAAATATPTIRYETGNGLQTVSGTAVDLSGSAVLSAILGNYSVQGQASGLAIGLLSSNTGQLPEETFQAVFADVEISAASNTSSTVLYRVNAGGPTVAAIDGGIAWSADTEFNNSPFLTEAGSNSIASFSAVDPGATVATTTPGIIFDTERWDDAAAPEMAWAFDVPEAGDYEVRLFVGNGFGGTSAGGDRIFDVAIEGTVLANLDDVDLSEQFGHLVGGMLSNTVSVTDGTLNIEFLHGVENPLINGIEILKLADETPVISIVGTPDSVEEGSGQVQISLLSSITVPTVETVDVTFEIVPGTATPQVDYEYLPGTFDPQTGIYTDTVTIAGGSSDATVLIDILQDTLTEGDEDFTFNIVGVSPNADIGTASATVTIEDDDDTVSDTVLYRVNAGGPTVAAIDGGIAWAADTEFNNSPFLAEAGSNGIASFSAVDPGATVATTTPGIIFDTERWDDAAAPEMAWAFDVPEVGDYEVRLLMGNGFGGTAGVGDRIFDIAIEGTVLPNLSDIDLITEFGHLVGGTLSNTVFVTDGTLDIEFLHVVENPLINGIEIIQVGGGGPTEDTQAPTASLNLPLVAITTETTAPQTIAVNFADNVDLDEATIDGDEIQVTDSTGNALAVSFAGAVGTVATYEVDAPGGSWDEADNDTYTVEVVAGSVEDVADNAIATTPLGSFDVAISEAPAAGAATFTVTVESDNVQISNFGSGSFQVENVGSKKIAKIELDVTNALYPDSIFDPFGVAGDTVSKPLTIDINNGTGVVTPSSASYIGAGGTAGFKGIELIFDETVEGGFEPGDRLEFSIDMDPNSIAGAEKSILDGGTNPGWDVGGVSGAELIGSTVTLTFTDGTTASSQLQGAGNQAGAQTLAAQDLPQVPVALSVNGLSAGSDGTYDANDPSVIVNGPAGQTARVVLTKGFIQPGTNNFAEPYKSQLDAQLASLAASTFPANNAVEFQTVDILLTGSDQDISNLFDFSNVADFDFAGEDQLALGFVASIIDPNNNNLPAGPVTQPIYLQFDDEPSGNTGVLYRVNAGGPELAAVDGGIAWSADTAANVSSFLAAASGNNTSGYDVVAQGGLTAVPADLFKTERWDNDAVPEMAWAFDTPETGDYEVRLFLGNGFDGTSNPGDRIFDVAIEGVVLANLDNVDLSGQFGHKVGSVISNTVSVTDGTLNIEFLHEVENPLVNGIEIVKLS